MWRLCDLHNHSTPNDKDDSVLDAEQFVTSCLDAGLDVAAITNHDHVEGVSEIVEAAIDSPLVVIPGIEISTDRGHILALAPRPDGVKVLRDFAMRIGAAPDKTTGFLEMIEATRTGVGTTGPFAKQVLLIGAHVDQESSLLGPNQPGAADAQLRAAEPLAALEVMNDAVLEEWLESGVKQSAKKLTLIRGSDSHFSNQRGGRSTWIYLPSVDFQTLRHALATPEASIRFETAPKTPNKLLTYVEFEGGMYDGLRLDFSERTNALIGPPSSGKSLVIDALRFAFGGEAAISQIRELCEARLNHCLPAGSSVRVGGTVEGVAFEIERHRGAAQVPDPPIQPIVFSQTELSRRAMEERPSMSLLDIHCPEAASIEHEIAQVRQRSFLQLDELLRQASEATDLSSEISNSVDGLAATRKELDDLSGSEPAARRANDISRVGAWRDQVRTALISWLNELSPPSIPELPGRPNLETDDVDGTQFMPLGEVKKVIERFPDEVRQSAKRIIGEALAILDVSDSSFKAADETTQKQLSEEGFEGGAEVLSRLSDLRTRLTYLEGRMSTLRDLEGKIDAGLLELRQTVGRASDLRMALRSARKAACVRVNASMRAFFARVVEDADPSSLDDLIEDAKVGSQIWTKSIPEIRESLERERLVESAIRFAQDRPDKLKHDAGFDQQDSIVKAALAHGKMKQLSDIATTWPTDSLDLSKKSSPPIPFESLTEGMRALAIKEISFAASDLPVISDQPEDAVPSQAVFQTLVPTLRRQRADRQFILASHDANIVVAGDVEKVWVLEGPGQAPESGTLADDSIRSAAIELLEGGQEAFEVRRVRYGT